MKKTLRILLCALFILGAIKTMVLPVFSQEDADMQEAVSSVAEISGEIVSVNAEESTIVVRYSEDEQAYEEVTLQVTEETLIEENGQPAEISDLDAGDDVSLVYTTDTTGGKIADSIWIQG